MASLLSETNIGLIGHVDHGKTTLTAALSGKWTDTHSESVKRGITIKLGYADVTLYECPKCKELGSQKVCKCGEKTKPIRMISLVDAPGHETLMAVMISGAAIMDGALLVIAANEPCPQPQTREHLAALKILDIKNILVVQNKVDLVTKAQALENYKQIKDFVKKSLGFEVPIIPVSAQKKINIDLLLCAIQEHLKTPKREAGENPEFLIARSFDINKPGADVEKLVGGVLGGSIVYNKFKVGSEIEILPGLKKEAKDIVEWKPIKTEIASIVCGGQKVDEKGPGGSIAMATTLDPVLTKSDTLVGNVAGLPGKLPPVRNSLELEVTLFDKVLGVKEELAIAPIKMNEPLMINIGTSTSLGIVSQAGKKIKLKLKRPICARAKTKVALSRRIGNRWHLIGYGIIL